MHTDTHSKNTAENTHAQINNKSHSSKREEEGMSEAFIALWDGKYKIWTAIHTFGVIFLLLVYKATNKYMTEAKITE